MGQGTSAPAAAPAQQQAEAAAPPPTPEQLAEAQREADAARARADVERTGWDAASCQASKLPVRVLLTLLVSGAEPGTLQAVTFGGTATFLQLVVSAGAVCSAVAATLAELGIVPDQGAFAAALQSCLSSQGGASPPHLDAQRAPTERTAFDVSTLQPQRAQAIGGVLYAALGALAPPSESDTGLAASVQLGVFVRGLPAAMEAYRSVLAVETKHELSEQPTSFSLPDSEVALTVLGTRPVLHKKGKQALATIDLFPENADAAPEDSDATHQNTRAVLAAASRNTSRAAPLVAQPARAANAELFAPPPVKSLPHSVAVALRAQLRRVKRSRSATALAALGAVGAAGAVWVASKGGLGQVKQAAVSALSKDGHRAHLLAKKIKTTERKLAVAVHDADRALKNEAVRQSAPALRKRLKALRTAASFAREELQEMAGEEIKLEEDLAELATDEAIG